jgi:hypothetical protein
MDKCYDRNGKYKGVKWRITFTLQPGLFRAMIYFDDGMETIIDNRRNFLPAKIENRIDEKNTAD